MSTVIEVDDASFLTGYKGIGDQIIQDKTSDTKVSGKNFP